MGHLNAVNGALYSALFYADHDLKAESACDAKREYADAASGADAVALKAGKLWGSASGNEGCGCARREPLYHAGMIARAVGDQASARLPPARTQAESAV